MPADHDARTSAAARLLCCAALALACKGDAPRPEPQELEAPAPAPRLGSFEPLPGAPTMPDDVAAALAAAWDARPSDYYARTRHLREDGGPRFVNRLFLETSPYLRQHAHNPVNWLPWGEEAFALARALGRPIFLSVGYSTCHWCHVMEEESFEDEEIAAVLNERFIAVKVDREERPDVDGVYMQAVQLMTRRGGWPMTVVMTADKLPFFAATYIPPRDGVRGARRGLLTLLGQLADAHARDPARLVAQGEKIAAELVRQNTPAPPEGVPGPELLTRAVAELAAEFDDIHAGFGPAPKFPPVDDLALLLRYHRRTGDAKALEMATRTLEAMAAGGLHDQIGGGFHRYATDRAWLVPHFEKMLYDNALLVGVYLDAYQLTGREEFAAVAGSTLDYLDREMCAGDGFYAATDADSLTPAGAREEGYYFTWAEAEIDAALEGLAPPDIAAVKAHYGVTPGGNFEGRSILHVARPLDALALELSRPREELAALVDDARQRLRRARDERPRPLRDDKLITAWNGLAISAFARGGFLLKREELLFRAVAVASRYDAGPLTRVVVDEAPRGAPVLADHVYLAQGMLDLFEATGQPRWLEAAVRRQAEADARYRDPATGVYYETAVDGEALLVRAIEDFDGATPSGSSIAAHNLLRLAVYQGDEAARERGVAVLRAFARALTARPTSLASLLAALERTLDSPREVAIVHPAPADAAALDALLQPVREVYSPSRALVIVAEPELDDRARAIPWLAGKRPRDGAPTAYVCERGRCEAPTADPATLRRQLAVVAPLPQPGPPDP